MTNKNEVANVNHETGEIQVLANDVVEETENYVVKRTPEGKFIRQAKYNDYSSVVAETRADKLWLLNVMEGDEDSGFGLKDNVGKEIEIQDVITRKYDRIDENTGETEYGVLTYLITPEKEVYVTSSKTVYFSLTRIMDLFGKPHEENWENIKVQVGKEKGTNGDIIKIKMIG